MDFTRSSTHCGSKSKWQEQINAATSYIDGSMIYGVNDEINSALRTHNDGLLKTNSKMPGFLPTRGEVGLSAKPYESQDDYITGDNRAQTHSTILATHVLWMREHNRVAKALLEPIKQQYPQLSADKLDELVFQEARKIVVAEIQVVVYNEWLPAILGEETRSKHRLQLAPDSQYHPEIDSSIRNEFSTAAYRFGHSLVQDIFEGKDQPWRLGKFFGDAEFATKDNGQGCEREIEGFCTQPMLASDRYITKELTQNLYNSKKVDNSSASAGKGNDLASINIQRGRDHGIPSYNAVRAFFGLRAIPNMDSKPDEITEAIWTDFKKVYNDPNDIDLYPGGLTETALPGGLLGPTFTYIIAEQFRFLKDGDRFFFTHSQGPDARGLPSDIQVLSIFFSFFKALICIRVLSAHDYAKENE